MDDARVAMDGEDDEVEPSQSVTIYLKLADDAWGDPDEFDDYELEDLLSGLIEKHDVGEFDGTGRGLGYFEMFINGPDADALWDVAAPAVRAVKPRPGSYVEKRYGAAHDPAAREVRIDL
jgi:hypothetical protein